MFFQEVLDIVEACFSTRQAMLDSTDLAQPFSRLRERNAHMRTAALSTAASERSNGSEGHQVSRSMIKCLRRQPSRLNWPGSPRFSVVESARRLNETCEAARIRARRHR